MIAKAKVRPATYQLLTSLHTRATSLTGVVTTGKVVGCILLATDELLRVEELAVGAGADLVDHSGLQIDEYSTGHVLACSSLAEEGVEGVIATSDGLVTGRLAIRLQRTVKCLDGCRRFN